MSKSLNVPIKIMLAPNSTPAEGRNIGARNSNGNFLAFLDADCIPPPHWLEKLLESIKRKFFKKNNETLVIGAVGATLLPYDHEQLINRFFHMIMQTLLGSGRSAQYYPFKKPTLVKSLPAGNFLCEKDLFERLGGFSSELRFCEDADLHYRIRKTGYHSLYVPGAEVFHLKKFCTLGKVARHIFSYGYGRALASKQKKYLMSPAYLLALIVFLLVIIKIPLLLMKILNIIPSHDLPSIIFSSINLISNLVILTYIFSVITETLILVFSRKEPKLIFYGPVLYVLVHASFIAGFLACWLNNFLPRR